MGAAAFPAKGRSTYCTPKNVQGHLRWAVEAYRQDAGADADRGVPVHAAIRPRPGAHPARQHRFQLDRDGAGQTELPSMRMPAEHEGKAGFGGLAIDFRRVRQQYREICLRYVQRGPANVFCQIKSGHRRCRLNGCADRPA